MTICLVDKRVVIGTVVGCVVILAVGGWWASGRVTPKAGDDPTSERAVKIAQEVGEQEWIKGAATAPVTVVEYADFQCPACAAYSQIMSRMVGEMPDRVRFVFRHYPLTAIHDKAWLAAKAAEAAGLQNKFWEMHDKLFAAQAEWSKLSQSQAAAAFEGYAKELGLDLDKWKADFNSEVVERRVAAGREAGDRVKVGGTPTFFVNDVLIGLPGSYEKMKGIVEKAARVVE